MILKLWQTDAPFDFKGDFWHIKMDAYDPKLSTGTLLKPYQQPHPPIGMSIVRGTSKAARMAGQRGYMPLSTNLAPPLTLLQHWETYCAGAEEAGQPAPDRAIWRVSRNIFVGETNAEAREHALNGTFGRSFEYLISLLTSVEMLPLLKHDPDMPDDDVTVEYLLEHNCIVGDVDTCIRQLEDVWESTGGFGTLLMIAHDWDDKAKWVRSMELLANEVVPAMPSI